MDYSEIAGLTAVECRKLIVTRQITAREAAEAAIARVEEVNGKLNAIVTLNERALDEARSLDRRLGRGEAPGLLHGLTVGIKDVTPVAGLRTTFGSARFANHVPTEDACVVQRLRSAGAVILGKTNTPEFAAGGNTFNEVFGATRNPWNIERSAGGSTGGGAAALASGMIALTEGTDLGGSLRIPASFCGIVGLRPSPGLVPTEPSRYLWDSLQVTGPMARTAEDVALMLQALIGNTRFSPVVQPVEGRDFPTAVSAADVSGLRIAYSPEVAGIGVQDDIAKACSEAAFDLAKAGARVEAVDLDLSFARETFLVLRGLWMLVHHYPDLDRADSFGENLEGNIRLGLDLSARDIAGAEQVRRQIWQRLRSFFEVYDYLLTPCMAVSPFDVRENYPNTVGDHPMKTYIDWIAPTFVLSLAALPVASVPCGLDDEGLPVGLQVMGPPQSEEGVLAVAGEIQKARPVGLPEM